VQQLKVRRKYWIINKKINRKEVRKSDEIWKNILKISKNKACRVTQVAKLDRCECGKMYQIH
jgi:hypothetical protein